MSKNRYINFVRPSSETSKTDILPQINGEEAKKLYLEEIGQSGDPVHSKRYTRSMSKTQHVNKDVKSRDYSKKDLFICVQNNDVQTLNNILDTCPNKINVTDDFGWSLLMIACQANSIDAVKELLKRGVDTSVRDKAGNSAQSLVIRNRNLVLVDILLSDKSNKPVTVIRSPDYKFRKTKLKVNDYYVCEICNKEFSNKEEHLSSTVHNISASKDKKIPTSYIIPVSNKGYQIMLKTGWDKESGLGPEGSGKKYPIRTVQKQDRKGLGLDKRKIKMQERNEKVKCVKRKLLDTEYKNSRNIEINFRRQFY